MNISLISGHSFWWILLFILMSFGLVYWQYFYKNTFKKELSKLRLILLASLRFLVVFFMLLLFLQPSIKNKSYIAHKPTLIFVQDNSKSILYNRDSSYYIDKYPLKVGTLLQELKSKYDVLKIGFGNDVQPLLNLNMRLGEGSGAALAISLLRTACLLHNNMATFEEAGI